MSIYQSLKEQQSSNSEFKLITSKAITRTYFDTNVISSGLAGLSLVAILDLEVFISQLFEELQD